jgi:heat shock 70kDa protein 1/2/6/8
MNEYFYVVNLYMLPNHQQKEYILGIDLGTSNCCNSVYRNGKVDVIPNASGNRTTPSYISFTDTEKLIGESAKNNVSVNSSNSVFDIKRLIGRLYNDRTVQSDIKFFPFKVSSDEKTCKPIINVSFMGNIKQYYPEQLSAMLLEQFKNDAQAYLNTPISKAIVTVPAYFNNEQRQATKDAGAIAGLDVVRIINEPTAAALAYGINLCETEKARDQNIVVFDFGGGTLDVSILNISNGCFEVISTSGDCHLGGEDCDNKLVSYCASEFAKMNKLLESDVIRLLKDTRAFRRLRTACENVKKALSTSVSLNVQVDAFFNSLDLNVKVTRAKFEELCHDIFRHCIQPLDNAMRDAKMTKRQIDEVILIGGTTRIPYVRDMLKDYFNGKQLRIDINPDEAVSIGAAIQGAILSGQTDKNISDVVLIDVTPLSLGIETSHGEMSKIIERNTPIPCSFKQLYSTETDNQRIVKIKIFEGERVLTKDNSLLGTFELADLPPMSRGMLRITVSFDVDQNGILRVSAVEETTSKTKELTIKKDDTKLSYDDVARLIEDAKLNAEIDEKIKATFATKNALENYLYSTKRALESLMGHMTNTSEQIEFVNASEMSSALNVQYNEICNIQNVLADAHKWYEMNPSSSPEVYSEKHNSIESVISTSFAQLVDNPKKEGQQNLIVKTNIETVSHQEHSKLPYINVNQLKFQITSMNH